MKKFNRGFTIAEIATTMAIVGVIAAMTVPMLYKNIQKHTYAATLARTTEQIELGCQNLLEYENSKRTDGSVITMLSQVDGNIMEKLAPFIGLTEDKNAEIPTFKDYAYLPTYHLGAPAYAVVETDLSNIRQKAIHYIDSKTFDDLGGGGGGGGGSTTPTVTNTDTNTDTNDEGDSYIAFPESTPEGPTVVKPFRDFGTITPINDKPLDFTPDYTSTLSKAYTSNSGKYGIVFGEPQSNQTEPTGKYLSFEIDTNGIANKPNMYGKDVFKFELLNNGKVKPFGNADDCQVGNVGNGQACAARVAADGWKIKY